MLTIACHINNFMFKHLGMGVMDEDRVQSGCKRGVNVRLRTVADHPRRMRGLLILLTDSAIRVRILLTRHFNGSEMVGKSGARELV